MGIFIINFILVIIYSILYLILRDKYVKRKKIKKFFCILITLQLMLILALRDTNVGRDLNNYVPFFKWFGAYGYDAVDIINVEIGYAMLNIAISSFTDNVQVLLFVLAIISIIPIGYVIYKYSKIPFLSFLLYIGFDFYAFLFSGLRQGVAFAVTFFSYKYIKENKPIKFIICILIASLFHKSALVFLLAYPLSKLKVNKTLIGVYFIIFAIIFIFRATIMSFFVNYLYDSYSIVESSSFTYMLLSIIVLLFGIVFYKQVLKDNKEANSLYIFIMMGVIFLAFTSVGTNMLRVANYYYMFVILYIPEVLSKIKDRNLLLICLIIIVMLLNLMYYRYLSNNSFDIIPYSTFIK